MRTNTNVGDLLQRLAEAWCKIDDLQRAAKEKDNKKYTVIADSLMERVETLYENACKMY